MSNRVPPRIERNALATFDLDRFLARPLIAHLATSSAQGARDSVFWYVWEEGALWVIAEEGFNTVQRRVRADPRVAVGIVDFDPRTGFFRHVSVRGSASIEAWDPERARRLLRRYYARLDGYVDRPTAAGVPVRGRLPMTFVRVRPESVLLREYDYREWVLARNRPAARGRRGRHPRRGHRPTATRRRPRSRSRAAQRSLR